MESMSATTHQPIAVTMGDPLGIGPELCLHLLQHQTTTPPPLIIGCAATLKKVSILAKIPLQAKIITSQDPIPNQAAILDIPFPELENLTHHGSTAPSGHASFKWLEHGIDLTLSGKTSALLTAPISKEAFSMAGQPYPGHTELLAERTKSPGQVMMFHSPEISCALATSHCPLREVPKQLSTEKILRTITLANDFIKKLENKTPTLALLGLNPHAGENGLFGNEEQQILQPALQQARAAGLQIQGPLPADTAFLPAKRKEIDAYIALYHDQGLIPVKTLAFQTAVNLTLGLPIIRTSPDHGTAYDIAWQGKADPTNFLAAYKLATRLITSPPSPPALTS